jgi:beta-glucosidase-like glycosyl hydrolase
MLINIKPEMITILLHMLKRHIILQTMNEECLKTVVSHFKYGPAPAISRLGIDPWSWNTECLRGDGNSGNATAFPQAIGLAASWR